MNIWKPITKLKRMSKFKDSFYAIIGENRKKKNENKVEIGLKSKIRKPITKLKRVQTHFDTIKGENKNKLRKIRLKLVGN